MKKLQDFWNYLVYQTRCHYVFVAGLLGSISLTLQQFQQQHADYKTMLIALGVAVGGYFGRNLRGKGISVAGLLGVAGDAFATVAAKGQIDWTQLGYLFILGLLSIIAPPPKLASYEKDPVIESAKEKPEKP